MGWFLYDIGLRHERVKETVFNIFNKYAPILKKYVRANEASFVT